MLHHALLANEYGAASGHARRLDAIAAALRGRGWRVTLAVRSGADTLLTGSVDAVREVPAPNTLAVALRAPSRTHASHADILEQFGLGSARFTVQRILLWRGVLREVRPDVVVSDNSPCLNLACRGRVPLVPVGNAVTLPPATLAHYPQLRRADRTVSQPDLLTAVNEACTHTDTPPLERLPEIYDGAAQGCIALPLLDPYAAQRDDILLPRVSRVGEAGRDRLVLYLTTMPAQLRAAMVEGAVRSGLPTLAVMPFATAKEHERGRAGDLDVRVTAVPTDELVGAARVAFGAGTPGFATDMAYAGVPQVAMGTDFERHLNAALLARAGIARRVLPTEATDVERIAAILCEAWEDEGLHARAAARAVHLRAQARADPFETLVDRIDALWSSG